MVHVVPVWNLGRSSVSAAVVGDDSVATKQEEHHLGVPVVRRKGPTMAEDNRLTGSPVFVEELSAVAGDDGGHGSAGAVVELRDVKRRHPLLATPREDLDSRREPLVELIERAFLYEDDP